MPRASSLPGRRGLRDRQRLHGPDPRDRPELPRSWRDPCRGHFPYRGSYEWYPLLRDKGRLAAEIDADWFIHYDADEIREAPAPYRTLREGIEAVDRQGYNTIHFDEFVFLPTEEDDSFEGTDYVQTMQYYYFFEPAPLWRVNAWRKRDAPHPNLTESRPPAEPVACGGWPLKGA